MRWHPAQDSTAQGSGRNPGIVLNHDKLSPSLTAPSYAHTTMQTMMMSSALQTPVCRPSRTASITSRPAVARPMRSSVVVRAEKGGPPPTVRHRMTRPPDQFASRRGSLLVTRCLLRELDAHPLAIMRADVGAGCRWSSP